MVENNLTWVGNNHEGQSKNAKSKRGNHKTYYLLYG